ncbi:MAG: cellobiose phosphorylase [Candidatus Omnitrophota bacterium]
MKTNTAIRKPEYQLDPNGEFVIENFNFSKPFANFFPGIAGPYGIPIWAFYVNRGQAISSFGTKDKDNAFLEFQPANKAWETTPLRGFRTFIKTSNRKNEYFYEPFANGTVNLGFALSNRMAITSWNLKLEEINATLGLKINVEYFTIPNDNFGALARAVTITNTGKKTKKISLLDGLPQIVPFGTNNFFLKEMSRTIEAWMNILNLENGVPFYKLAVDPVDKPEVVHIREGNFYLGFHYHKGKPEIIKPIVDPRSIFGPVTDFTCPYLFLHAKKFRYPGEQLIKSQTPCAFSLLDFELAAGGQKSFYAAAGYMPSEATLNAAAKKIIAAGYLADKCEENKQLINSLQDNINTESSLPEFDLYARQTYLDNLLRGGYPVTFKSKYGSAIFYLYSRKHGDLERDYNKFQLQPAYFSQGNGNYRDVNQNRRSDVWFNPEIKDENIVGFFNLLQLDGFNPLVVKGSTFIARNVQDIKTALARLTSQENLNKIAGIINKPFSPGELILHIEESKIKLNLSYDEFLDILLPLCDKNQEAEHGEGFWTDHWTYNLDLLENYLGVYPENLKEIIFEKKDFTFYDNAEVVRPRNKKYVIYKGSVKQLHSVGIDPVKKEMIRKRHSQPNTVRAGFGEGQIYRTTLINKLLSLAAVKAASLDPFGVGVEMEANKPNWYDALNGLPALCGSSVCETMELKRLVLFIISAITQSGKSKITVTEEIYGLLSAIDGLIREYFTSGSQNKDFTFWDKSHSLMEEYRLKTKTGLSGAETEIPAAGLSSIMKEILKKLNEGIEKALDKKTNIYCAYFINEVVKYELTADNFVRPLAFRQKRLPLFLESQVHALKLAKNSAAAKFLYEPVKASPLYDKKLKMYKETADLSQMPEEIGRCRIFTPGWLENESIWLHMEYKYLLEILRAGLYEEFYKEFRNILIPFMDPQIYGRSILENSSFIASSAFPDKNIHGQGFVARLSGSTAEFLSIWLAMNSGLKPFFLNENGELNLRFAPVLPGWLFDKKGDYKFNFFGKTLVTYHNKKRKNTFGKDCAQIKRISLTENSGKLTEFAQKIIPAPYAEKIRNLEVKSIEIYLE